MKQPEKTIEASGAGAQKAQAHKPDGASARPGKQVRDKSRYGMFDLKANRDWMFPLRRNVASVAAALLIFAGCSEADSLPTPAQMIEGHWSGGAWAHETNLYHFHEGEMWAAKCDGEALLDRREYAYFFAGDTMKVVDVASGYRHEFVCSFPSGGEALLERPGVDLKLMRVK